MKSGSTNITERVGRTVLYTLTADDARYIMERRRQLGAAQASANDVRDGDTYPAIIVRDFGLSMTVEAVAERRHETTRHLSAQYRMSQGDIDTGEHGYPVEFATMSEREFQTHLAEKLELYTRAQREAAAAASVNLRVLLDGYDTYWASSRSLFDPKTHGRHLRTENSTSSGPWEPDPRGHWQPLSENR